MIIHIILASIDAETKYKDKNYQVKRFLSLVLFLIGIHIICNI